MEVSHEIVSEERKRELISRDLREKPYLRNFNPTTLFLRRNIRDKDFHKIEERLVNDDLYKGEITDETIDWVIETYLKGIPWHECFYKEEPDKRG
jgi:hypothetical protein